MIAKTPSINDRINDLNKRYLKNCMTNNNEQIIDLIKKYKNWYPNSRNTQTTKRFFVITGTYCSKIKSNNVNLFY